MEAWYFKVTGVNSWLARHRQCISCSDVVRASQNKSMLHLLCSRLIELSWMGHEIDNIFARCGSVVK